MAAKHENEMQSSVRQPKMPALQATSSSTLLALLALCLFDVLSFFLPIVLDFTRGATWPVFTTSFPGSTPLFQDGGWAPSRHLESGVDPGNELAVFTL